MTPIFPFGGGEEVFELEKVGRVAPQQDEVGVGLTYRSVFPKLLKR